MLRREVVKMAGSLFGLGAGTPSRFPYADRPQPSPGVGPGQSAVVRANTVIVFGPAGRVVGVFVYSPGSVPGPGNAPVGWVSASPADPFGNALPSGTGIIIGTQNSGTVIGLGAGELIGYAAGELAGGVQFPGSNDLRLVSPLANGLDTAAELDLYSAATFGFQRMTFNGQVIETGGTPAAPTLITTDTWNSLGALAAGSGYTVNNGRYQLDNNGFSMVDINLTAGAATVAGGYSFTNSLPAAYRPLLQCSYNLGYNGTTAAGVNTTTVRISPAGLVQLQLPVLPNNTVLSATIRMPTN